MNLFLTRFVVVISCILSIHSQEIFVPGTRVSLNYTGERFKIAERFNGFICKDFHAQIEIIDRNTSFKEVFSSLSDKSLHDQGYTILNKLNVSDIHEGLNAHLVKVKKKSLLRWFYTIGNEQSTMMLKSSHPEGYDSMVSDAILNILMSVDYHPNLKLDTFKYLDYKLNPTVKFPVLYSEGPNVFLSPKIEDEKLLATQIQVFSEPKPNDFVGLQDWSKKHFKDSMNLPDLKVYKSNLIKMNNMNTYFHNASAITDGIKSFIFFANVEFKNFLVTFVGSCRIEQRKKYYPEFIKIIKTLSSNNANDLPKTKNIIRKKEIYSGFGVKLGSTLEVGNATGDFFQVSVSNPHPLKMDYYAKIGKNSKSIARIQGIINCKNNNEAETTFFKLGRFIYKNYGSTFSMPMSRVITYETPETVVAVEMKKTSVSLIFHHKKTYKIIKSE